MNLSLYYFIGQDTGIGLPLEKWLRFSDYADSGCDRHANSGKISKAFRCCTYANAAAFYRLFKHALDLCHFQERFNIIEYFASIGIATSILCFPACFSVIACLY